MQVRTGYPEGQSHAVGCQGPRALLVPRRPAAAVAMILAYLDHQHAGTQPMSRLYAAPGQPVITPACLRIHSLISSARSLST